MNKGKVKGVFYRSGIAYIRYIDERGRERKESTHQRTRKFAESLLAKRKTEVMELKHFPAYSSAHVLFGELLDYWWTMHGQSTSSGFQYLLPRVKHAFAHWKALQIHPDDIELFLMDLQGQGFSASSCNHHRTILNSVFNFALRRKRFYGVNPVRGVAQFREPAGRNRVPSREEFQRLLKEVQYTRTELWVFLIVVVTTAARKGEVLSRRWEEAHLTDPVPFLHVPSTKNGEPKDLILTEAAVHSLRCLPSYQRNEYLFPSRPTTRVPSPKSPHRWDFGKEFRRACRAAGIEGLRIHDLRHAGPSVLLERGISEGIVRKLTGHKSRELDRYQHLSKEVKRQTVDLIAEAFLEQIPEQSKPRDAGEIRAEL